MAELANLVNAPADVRESFGPKFSPFATLSSVARAMRGIGGLSLCDLIDAEANAFTNPQPPSPLSQTRTFLLQLLLPFLDNLLSHDCADYLFPRLIISPTLIPLTQRGLPNVLEDGRIKDSYAICLKAVIPSSIELPGDRLNFIPFPLFQAQAECVAQHSLGRKSTLGRPTRSPALEPSSIPDAVSIQLPTSPFGANSTQEKHPRTSSDALATGFFPSDEGRLYRIWSDGDAAKEGVEEEEGTMHAPPPADIPHFDPQWVVELIRKSIVPAAETWSWGEIPPSRVGSRRSGL